jgi:acetylglutamate kinase
MIIKVGGNELDNPDFLHGLAQAVAGITPRPVIVHGGGRGTTLLMERFGLQAHFLNGLRVTDSQTLQLAVMGMVGQASMQVVQALVQQGIPALGLSGADAALVTAAKLAVAEGDLGAVGTPVAVNAAHLQRLLDAGFLPCLAPICISESGDLFNVNADHVAQAVAVALEAEQLIFLTNVPAVAIKGNPIAAITPDEIETAIADGQITGGMIPKTRAATVAIAAGVQSVVITNLDGLAAIGQGESTGTVISQYKKEN